jgi:hypothetical protein
MLQGRQANREARHRLEAGTAELLTAAVDILLGARALRVAHGRRTKLSYYFRVAGELMAALPEMTSVQVLREWETMRPALSTLMRLERAGLEDDRTIALDTATVLSPKLTRYFAAVALLTLGDDKVIADGVRKLTPKVTAISEGVAAPKRKFRRLESDLQKATEEFRALADKHLGNVK